MFGDDETFRYVSGYVTEDQQFLVIYASNTTTGNRLYAKDLTDPQGQLVSVVNDETSDVSVIFAQDGTLYAQTNRWKLIMLTVKDAAGIDGRDAREMLRKLGARRSLAEVAAWSGDDLAAWFGHNQQYLARLQPMAREGSITIGALLDGVVADDMKAVLPDAADVKAKIAVRTKLRIAAREQLPTLVVPPSVLKVMEASLHADVAERPRDAAAICNGAKSARGACSVMPGMIPAFSNAAIASGSLPCFRSAMPRLFRAVASSG